MVWESNIERCREENLKLSSLTFFLRSSFLKEGMLIIQTRLLHVYVILRILIGLNQGSKKYSQKSTNTDFYSLKGQRFVYITMMLPSCLYG